MKRLIFFIFLTSLPIFASANCDLTHFRWDCEILMHTKPSPYASSLIQCDRTFGYIRQSDYDILKRYQRANVSLHVMLNGEYVDGPCIPAGR